MAPFEEPETVATPPAKVIAVTLPKATAEPLAFVTVGVYDPIVLAPEKVRLCEPV